MSFEYEGTVTTSASPKDVWHLWSDVGSWHCWDPSVQQVCMEGHFAEGAAGTMTLVGGLEAPFVLEIVEPNSRFLDRVTMGDLVIHIDHEVKATDTGSEVTVRTHISGPGAADVGPMVTGDTPKALEALVRMAEQKS
jgi:Polyketide cyclase / dehydrase and lipid transport